MNEEEAIKLLECARYHEEFARGVQVRCFMDETERHREWSRKQAALHLGWADTMRRMVRGEAQTAPKERAPVARGSLAINATTHITVAAPGPSQVCLSASKPKVTRAEVVKQPVAPPPCPAGVVPTGEAKTGRPIAEHRKRVFEVIGKKTGPFRTKEVAREANTDPKDAHNAIWYEVKKGTLKKLGRGLFQRAGGEGEGTGQRTETGKALPQQCPTGNESERAGLVEVKRPEGRAPGPLSKEEEWAAFRAGMNVGKGKTWLDLHAGEED